MYITILANQSTMPPLKSLEAFLASHRIQVLSKEVLPVPRTLADRRYAEGWVLDAADQDALALAFSAVGLDDGVDVNAQLPTDRPADIKLAVFDMDSTLIDCEVIDELAAQAGVGQEVAEITGHEVGGVCPFGLPQPLPVYCDVSLKRFEEVVPAAGAINAAVRIAPDRLAALTDAQWVDVCQ